MFNALIKVGGSLYNYPDLHTIATAWAVLAATHRLLVLAGGGPFADQVRAADANYKLSQSAAHWMAILAMDQYAYLLADLTPQAVLVRDLVTAEQVCQRGQLAILAPSALLLRLDPLPHSWQITSDSIAAWLAKYAGIGRVILLKSVAGVYAAAVSGEAPVLLQQISRLALAQYDLVDPCFARTLPPLTDCWLIDGRQPERLAELLNLGRTEGTQVMAG